MDVFGNNHRNTDPNAPKHHYAVWNEKAPYAMTVHVVEGTIAVDDIGWGFAAKHRYGAEKPVYLGELETIETREQKRVSSVTHQGDDMNDVVTVTFLPDGWSMVQHRLSTIVDDMGCVAFWVGAWKPPPHRRPTSAW